MQKAWIQWRGAAAAAVLTLLAGTPLKAADNAGVRPVAEELGQRTKPPAAAPGGEQNGVLSDSAVRVLMTYAFSIIPDEAPGPDGKQIKLDKSDPNMFVIPTEDARRVIRVATRSAYAQVCDLPELERANYQTLIKGEEARKVWSQDQLLLINALHMFAVSYFTGSVKVTTKEEAEEVPPSERIPAAGEAGAPAKSSAGQKPKAGTDDPQTQIVAPKRPDCPPEQKQKVTNAINAYVQAAKVSAPASAAGQTAKPAAQAVQPAPAPVAKPATQASQPAPAASGAN
jgi:hypothetical protein